MTTTSKRKFAIQAVVDNIDERMKLIEQTIRIHTEILEQLTDRVTDESS